MKAVLIRGKGKVEVVFRDRPVPEKREALLRILTCGFCGTDIATYSGQQPFARYPVIPGHEFVANIEELNGFSMRLHQGMWVAVNPYKACGKCNACFFNSPNCCEKNQTMGVQRDGAFAEYITAPFDKIYPLKNVNTICGCLVEPLAVALHGIERGRITNRLETILIVGDGTIGTMLAFALVTKNYKRIKTTTVLGKHAFKLKLIKDLIGVKTENSSNSFLSPKADICIEASGKIEGFMKCFHNVRNGGRIVLIGNNKGYVSVAESSIVEKEITIIGSRNALPHNFKCAIRLLQNNNNLVAVANNFYVGLNEAPKAFEEIYKKETTSIKNILLL